MSILNDFEIAMQSTDPATNIDYISDVFKRGIINQSEAIELSNSILKYALQEKNNIVRESLFHALCDAVVYSNIGSFVVWDELVDNISTINSSDLEYALTCLGFSHQDKYISVLKSYLNHNSPHIREVAQEALQELENRL